MHIEPRSRTAQPDFSIPLLFGTIVYSIVVNLIYLKWVSVAVISYVPSSITLQTLAGFIRAFPLGLLLPLTILTPPVIIFAMRRDSIKSTAIYLGAALIAGVIAFVSAESGHQYLSPFWQIVIGCIVQAPLLAIWTALLTIVVRRVSATG